jgi:hypothetical protein
LPFFYDVATTDQNWQTALDHCGQVANSKAVALFGQNKLGFNFGISATNTYYVTHDEEIAYYLKTFGRYDRQGGKTLNEREPFKFTFDQEIWPDLNVKEVRDDVKFLRKTVGVNHRGEINICGIAAEWRL